jgi:exodeoxyribonuclease VII large subunit
MLRPMVWSVAGLVHAAGDAIAARFSACAVAGELSGFTRAASGHCYFSLKDGDGTAALIRCAMFKRAASLLDFQPSDGLQVQLRGRLAVYEPRGELQFVVESMTPDGDGALYAQFLRLKLKLTAEGLFEAARKRSVAAFPRRIGVVTSTAGAALHDVIASIARRAPHVELLIYPSVVQGADAPQSLCAAIEEAGRRREVDTLIVCRGGGSLQDLWAFNDERVVRSIAACPIPIVSGVGHETDTTLADFVADLRATTPTAAAELAVPSTDALLAGLSHAAESILRSTQRAIDTRWQRLDSLSSRLLRPAEAMYRQARSLDLWASRLRMAARARWTLAEVELTGRGTRLVRSGARVTERHGVALARLAARLQGLDPSAVLQRGYAWLNADDGAPLTSARQLTTGGSVSAAMSDGSARLRVISVDLDR